jgi:3-hydroxyacyl-CoA dehydrogenase
LALFALNIGLFEQIDELVASGQKTYMNVKYAPFPVVAAPFGMALGGGCEILLHVDAVVAHAETYTGLVEVGVGFDPRLGWLQGNAAASEKENWVINQGPCRRLSNPSKPCRRRKHRPRLPKRSASAIFRDGVDSVVMNRDRLLFDAKTKSIGTGQGLRGPKP